MIVALLTGRGGSKGLKNKNTYPVLGRPLMVYALLAARHVKHIAQIYLSTDSDEIARIGLEYGAEIIRRPPYLATDESLHQDAIVHGYEYIANKLKQDVEVIVILLCNCATIDKGIIDRGIEMLLADESIDSCVTVSRYNQYNPIRANKIVNGLLLPFEDMARFTDASGERDSVGDIYFCDSGAFVCRARCMDLSYGRLPYRWTGQKVVPLIQEGGLDVDNEQGLVLTEYWLRKHGFTETSTPYED